MPGKTLSNGHLVHKMWDPELHTKNSISMSTQVPAENPLYRRIFVGREQELKQLKTAFDGAMSGQGSLVMVVGEPGIGKTSVCEQLKTYVTLKGGKTLIGYCYEEGSLSLPYLAFVEAMRSYVLDREVEDLKKELGSGATDVARIVSEVREKLHVKPRESQNPEEDRYRLMQAVTSFLAHAAAVKPIMVLLEDLHDADKGTLEMLSYVSRNLGNTRLLIVGTYRDVEVDRTHPLSAALAELRRVSTFGRVLLRGLSAEEVGRMLSQITGEEIPFGLAQAVHNQTEGNPLFVQEVVRYLTEEKLLVHAGGKLVTSDATTIQMSIPEGLRDVIGKRLSNLSDECNRILSIAAVIGREFRLDVLQMVADIPEENLLTAIEEAKNVAIIEERATVAAAVTYRFAHAFFRTILYEENIAPRRIRLHQQVAKALEEVYASRLQEHAAELAEHFSYSTEPADLTKAVSYGEMAAQRAADVYEYGEAVRLLRQAIKVQEVLDPEDKGRRCDLLTKLGRRLTYTPESTHAVEFEYPEALALAEEIGDKKRASLACSGAALAIMFEGSEGLASPIALTWAEKANQYSEPDTLERARADFVLGGSKSLRGNFSEGIPLVKKSLQQAIGFGDQEFIGWASYFYISLGVNPWSGDDLLELADKIKNGNFVMISTAYSCYLFCGYRDKADELSRVVKERSELTSHTYYSILWMMIFQAQQAIMNGKLIEAVEMLDNHLVHASDAGFPGLATHATFMAGLRLTHYMGKAEDYPESKIWDVMLEEANQPVHRRIPLLPAYLGQYKEVNEMLDRMIKARPEITSRNDYTHTFMDIAYLESATLSGHKEAAELILQRFSDCSTKFELLLGITCVTRHLGAAAALLERYDKAKVYYEKAIRDCTELRHRPELALSHLGLAELLLDHYPDEKSEAIEQLDTAIKEFREMKMQPALEKALRRKDILKA
jgi:tetratricopeptide (TPR) repeat protein